jgi:CRISPR/Cas system-associated protein Csm6
MPFYLPYLAAVGIGGWIGSLSNNVTQPVATPTSKPAVDYTMLAGYAIGGALVYYFGKKLLKA